MQKVTFGTLSILLFSATTVACSSSSPDGDTSSSAQAQTSLVGACTGEYVCTSDGSNSTATTELHHESDGCYAGGVRMNPDGTADVDGDTARWTGDASAFDVCVDGNACLHCTAKNPPPGATAKASSSEAKCTGSPRSCESNSPPDCGDIEGCYMDSSYDAVSDTWDNECAGSPHSCSSFHDESSCKDQGCTWQ